MPEFGISVPVEACEVKFAECCQWAVSHPSMPPKGDVNYHDHTYRVAMNELVQDVAKKPGKFTHRMWQGIADARAAFMAANYCIVIEPVGLLPDFGNPTTDLRYVSGNQ